MRNSLYEQYSEMIQFGLRKSYRLIIEDNTILSNFLEEKGQGGKGPDFAFKQLMRSISQVKTNVELLLNNQFASSLRELDMIMSEFI